jgi:hypothetical protein
VLNRIRRAFTLTRARNSSRGRHRRALTPSCPPASPSASHESVGVSTPFLGRAVAGAATHRNPLIGEDVAPVRPYVMASERRVQTRSMVIAPHLPSGAWSFLTGGR